MCSPSDLAFLQSEGCFHLPAKEIFDQIVEQYFLHVHPLLPILHEGDFWRVYSSKSGHKDDELSLLVVQALIFASCNVSFLPPTCRSQLTRAEVSTVGLYLEAGIPFYTISEGCILQEG